jgi:hypothetical protein
MQRRILFGAADWSFAGGAAGVNYMTRHSEIMQNDLAQITDERSRRHGPASSNPQAQRHDAVNAARLQKRKGRGAARKGRPFFIAV